jgi:site-specific DNA recombinase
MLKWIIAICCYLVRKIWMKRSQTSKRYAFYLRCSSDDQKHGDYTTIDTQREINRDYIKSHGGDLSGEYVDEGKSGANLNRPGWKKLIEDAGAGCFDVVAVTYMSRLGRGNAFIIAEYELGKFGVKVEMVREQFSDDLAGYIGKATTNMMDGLYPKMVSQWTRTKMEQMVASGYFCGGQPPLGYQKEIIEGGVTVDGKEPPKILVPDTEFADIVRYAFDLFLTKRTVASVREYLNSVTNRRYTSTTAKYLLTNEIYIGNYNFGDWRKEDVFSPIVAREVWNEVQEILRVRANTKVSREPVSDAYTYYLRGLVHCPHCQCVYTNSCAKGGTVRYYECLSHAKRKSKCPVQRINAEALHASVLNEIQRATRHHTVMHQLIAESGGWASASQEKTSLRGQLSKRKQYLDMQAGNYLKAVGEGRGGQYLFDALDKVEQEQQRVLFQLSQVEDEIAAVTVIRPTAQQVQEVWASLLELWDDVTELERQELLSGMITRVNVTQKNRVSMELITIPEEHGHKFGTKSQMGAGVGLEPTTFGL